MEQSAKENESESCAKRDFGVMIQDDLSKFAESLSSHESLQEQTAELREHNARLEGQLEVSKTSTAEALRFCDIAKSTEELLRKRISDLVLEVAASRQRQSESSAKALSHQELQSTIIELRSQLEAAGGTLAKSEERLELKDREFQNLRQSMSGLKASLDVAETRTAAFDREKTELEQKVKDAGEHARAKLSRASFASIEAEKSSRIHAEHQLELANNTRAEESKKYKTSLASLVGDIVSANTFIYRAVSDLL